MAKVEILAQSFNPFAGYPIANPRIEIIDTETNALFKKCKTLTDVAETYMRYWNRLPTLNQSELVLVQSIKWV